MFAVEWSEWVVRLPGSGGSPVWTIVLLLGLGFFLTVLLNSLKSFADRISGLIGPLVGLLLFALAIYAINFFIGGEEIEPSGPLVTVTIGIDDCESQLVDRCPTQDDGGLVTTPTVADDVTPVPTTG